MSIDVRRRQRVTKFKRAFESIRKSYAQAPFVSLALSAASLSACGSDDDRALSCPIAIPPGGCDVFDGSCQTTVFHAAQCERNGVLEGSPPLVTVVSVKELQDSYRAQLEKQVPSQQEQDWDRAVALFGLIESEDLTVEGQTQTQTENLLGFYSPSLKSIVLVRHEVALAPLDSAVVLAHEYIHALQDREFDLGRYLQEHNGSFDSDLAGRAAIEGEARLFEAFSVVRNLGRDPARNNWPGIFQQQADTVNNLSRMEPSPLARAVQYFPYTYGAAAAAAALAEAGATGITALHEDPQLSSRSIMARTYVVPEAAPQPDAAAPPAILPETDAGLEGAGAGEAGPAPPPGASKFEVTGSYGLGAWILHAFLLRNSAIALTPELAFNWQADRFQVFKYNDAGPANGSVLVDWAIRLSSPAAADALQQQLQTLSFTTPELAASWLVRRVDTTLHLIASDGGRELSDAFVSSAPGTQLGVNEPEDVPFARQSISELWR